MPFLFCKEANTVDVYLLARLQMGSDKPAMPSVRALDCDDANSLLRTRFIVFVSAIKARTWGR